MATISVCHVFLLFLLHLPLLTSAQSNRNITMRSPLSSLDKNSYWTSPSGEFAFGFYPHDQDLFLLAIWFDKIPPKTIVWTANDGKPVEKGATIQLTSNGVLSLQSQDGTEIWKTQPTNTAEVSYGALLDTGNLVLISTNSTILWASFDIPTDTILPSQILNSGSLLSSRATEKDYTKGRFQFTVQADGNLVLNSMARPTDDKYIAYWASHTWMQGTQLVFNQSGSIYQILRNASSRFYLSTDSPKSTALYYQRVTLDVDGVLRKYTYPREMRDHGNWSTSWSVPENICAADFGQLGSGLCGFNSYCKLDKDQKPACECPPGYTYFDPENTFKGCKPNFLPQICGETSEGFEILEIPSIDWPSNEYEYIKSQTADWCSKTCLNDCLCAAAVIVNGTECLLKKFPLSNGRLNPVFHGTTLVKVGNEKTRSAVGCEKEKKWILPVVTVLGICIILVLVWLTLVIYLGRNKKDGESKNVTQMPGVKTVG